MNTISSSNSLKDPSVHQVKIRRQQQTHEYVVPSRLAAIPSDTGQTRTMKIAHHNHHGYKRLSLPSSIREEEDEDLNETLGATHPIIIQNNNLCEDDDENTPLAVLAYRKGFVVPVNAEKAFPLVQHVQLNKKKQQYYSQYPDYYYNPCHINSPTMLNYHHPTVSHHDAKQLNPNISQQQQSFYQLNHNYSHSPSSSNSSLSSIENHSRQQRDNSNNTSLSSSGRKFYRRQSSHI